MPNQEKTPWTVVFTGKARKQKSKLPKAISSVLDLLNGELEAEGPERTTWPHYGKISGRPGCHHCHILRGRPTYVAVWRENIEKNEIEVLYVGSHESANYRRIC